MGSVSAQAAQTTSALSKFHAGERQDAVCDGVCVKRIRARAGACDGQPERHRWNSEVANNVNETLTSAPVH